LSLNLLLRPGVKTDLVYACAVGARLRIRGLAASATRIGTVEDVREDGLSVVRFDDTSVALPVDLRSPLEVSLAEPFAPQYELRTTEDVEVRVRLSPTFGAGSTRWRLRAQIECIMRREVTHRPMAASKASEHSPSQSESPGVLSPGALRALGL
jgi:hypothetical protein